ncbi:HU family DNA-binding protein [Aeromonas caviae]|uniref:HU family DNA-binding protein n=1 Tax=Aeromonas caviae TaxID=648 RepID=A0AAJ5ZEJ7_AERCA|nr:HU family DNA-binding protein [Aeromonas caviae]WFG00171.1 HU family DNA-binding protein [Aeromonas caviae]
MNKQELVSKIAESADISMKDAKAALDAMIDTITSSLTEGGEVSLVGFGTFNISNRAARTGRNPQTGATLEIPASRVPSFKPGKALKDRVNG